ncbi:MAG: HpcH/HpaI aldolase family protein [Candidatus Zipacnadales bacterium]
MRQNRVLAKIKAGEPAIVGWLISGSPLMAESLTVLDYDGFLLDAQHGYWSYEGLLQTLMVLADHGRTPLVRVAENNFGLIGRTLDAGALGIVIPMVNTAEHAQAAVEACRYPPAGKRSSGGLRRERYGDDYVQAANQEIMVICMIETPEAVAAVDDIMAVSGIDCIMIGPGDLSIAMGCFPDPGPEHAAAIEKVVAAGKRHGVAVGMACLDAADCIYRAQQGMRFLPCGNEIGWARTQGQLHLETVRAGLTNLSLAKPL